MDQRQVERRLQDHRTRPASALGLRSLARRGTPGPGALARPRFDLGGLPPRLGLRLRLRLRLGLGPGLCLGLLRLLLGLRLGHRTLRGPEPYAEPAARRKGPRSRGSAPAFEADVA